MMEGRAIARRVLMVPALGFFLLAERRIVGGLAGSVKG
jgi:hypothetical protein